MIIIPIFIITIIVIFFLLNLLTGGNFKIGVAGSCSMYYQGNLFSNFDDWWENHGEKYSKIFLIDKEKFQSYKFKNGINMGDIILFYNTNPKNLKVGDVIIYNKDKSQILISHRIIKIYFLGDKRMFSTMGDNNLNMEEFENEIKESQIIRKAVFKIAPYLEWIRIIFDEGSLPEVEKGFCEEMKPPLKTPTLKNLCSLKIL